MTAAPADPAPRRLFIIDAMALAFRSHYAFGTRPLTTADGRPTSAIFGSALFLHRLLESENPDYLVVAADPGGPTFRHEMYKEYKANREAMPEDLKSQLPDFFRLFEKADCPVLKINGFEADDIIGTLARKYAGPDLQVFIVSGDKDFLQLVGDDIKMYAPKKGEDAKIYDREAVIEKFGCPPEKVIDALAIIGDASDNVPGVKGIGGKGAAKLLSTFKDLDAIYANLDEITGKKQKEALQEYKDSAYLSRELVTIKTDIELDFELDSAEVPSHGLVRQELVDFYEDMEFRGLVTKLRHQMEAPAPEPAAPFDDSPLFGRVGASSAPSAKPTPAGPKDIESESAHVTYQLVADAEAFQDLLDQLWAAPVFCVDTETTGLDVVSDEPIGISLALKPGEAFYVPLVEKHLGDLSRSAVLEGLGSLLASDKLKIGHNIKFDWQMFRNIGIDLAGPFGDTMLLDFLIDAEERGHGLDKCCLRHLNYKKIPTSDLIGKGAAASMLDVPLQDLTRYACEDTDLTLQLFRKLNPRLKEFGLEQVYHLIEMPLIPVLGRMEQTGIRLDPSRLDNLRERIVGRLGELEIEIHGHAGRSFNIKSPKQLGEVLFDELKVHEALGIKKIKKTKTGYATNEGVLSKMTGHPLPRLVLEYRELAKLLGTYVDALPALVHPKTGRIHASFHQTGAATGRLSSSEPNLQNIPVRTELGREVRRAFRPATDDRVFISADYSQIELRLLAHVAEEDTLAEAFRKEVDIHHDTAARVFGTDDVTPEMRSRAKAINFGLLYGMGARRLADETGTTRKEAEEFIERYFSAYPGIRTFIDSTRQEAHETLESRTITGRRRSIETLIKRGGMGKALADNIAINTPIQGSAADLIKLAMSNIEEKLAGFDAPLILQVHDELVFECPKDKVEEVTALVKEGMETAMNLRVPLRVDVGTGADWLEAH